jgi:hypothetical protein
VISLDAKIRYLLSIRWVQKLNLSNVKSNLRCWLSKSKSSLLSETEIEHQPDFDLMVLLRHQSLENSFWISIGWQDCYGAVFRWNSSNLKIVGIEWSRNSGIVGSFSGRRRYKSDWSERRNSARFSFNAKDESKGGAESRIRVSSQ